MNLPQEVSSCAICPRLCRDVCPVAVHAGRDDLVPSEKMRAVAALLGAAAGVVDGERLHACTDCGACTEHCLLQVPVAPWLDAARQRWLEHEQGDPPPRPPEDPAAATILPAEVPDDAWLLPTCGGAPDGCRDRLGLAQGQRHLGSPVAPRPAKADPSEQTPGLRGQRHEPAMGSTCCGQRLHVGVGGADLRQRMARTMAQGLPDHALVVVSDAACAGHLAAAVGDRLQVRQLLREGDEP